MKTTVLAWCAWGALTAMLVATPEAPSSCAVFHVNGKPVGTLPAVGSCMRVMVLTLLRTCEHEEPTRRVQCYDVVADQLACVPATCGKSTTTIPTVSTTTTTRPRVAC
jgi:hypothetical protein